MLYRPIGKTGMSASIIGLGAEHLDNKPYSLCEETVQAALAAGVNIIDVFMPGAEIRDNLYKALGGRRNDVLLQGHIGSVEMNGQYDRTRDVALCSRYIDDFLHRFHTDYIDIGMIFYTDTEEDYRGVFETPYIDYVLKLKKEGKIRAVGASSHHPETAARIVETGAIDLLMFPVNPAYDMLPQDANFDDVLTREKIDGASLTAMDPRRARLYQLCERRGVAITTMKTLGAGKLISPAFTPFQAPMTVGQCIHYALTRPGVVSSLIGCVSREQVGEALRYLDLSPEERDFSKAVHAFRKSLDAGCMYCNHCLPCPSQIDIAAMTKLLDAACLDEASIPEDLRRQYRSSTAKASDCIECGSCQSNCPFHINVIENMRRAAKLFGR